MATAFPAPAEAKYPESGGKPMAETPMHRDAMIALIDVLRFRFAGDPMTYVSGNMFLYFLRGNPRRCVVPDVFIARVGDDPNRRVYRTWEEGNRGPELVIEVTSPSTREQDLYGKFALYQDILRVPEYFLFDPLDECLDPRLVGYRLINGEYQPIPRVDGRVPSEVLSLHFEAAGDRLRLYDPATGQVLMTSPEARALAEQAWEQAETARVAEYAARLAAEEEVARLRRELDELRRGSASGGG